MFRSPFVSVLLTVLSLSVVLASAQEVSQQERDEDAAAKAHKALLDAADHASETARFTDNVMMSMSKDVANLPVQQQTFIDDILFRQMSENNIPHASLTSDAEFMRRLYLDTTGLPPQPEDIRSFVSNTSNNKRKDLVDKLVGTEEFAEQWAWFWGDLFRLASQVGPGKTSFQFWVKEWLKIDRPYDEVVHDLITGVSKVHSTIPALQFLARSHQVKSRIVMSDEDYSINNRLDSIDQFNVDSSRVFLGINTSCISCHDGAAHLETVSSWLTKQDRADFYRHSAFFGKTRLITSWDDRSKNVVVDYIVDDLGDGYNTGDDAPFQTLSENRFPRFEGETYKPAFLLTGEEPRAGFNERAELARMITTHPQFARATANLIWGKLMSIAFVEPYNAFDLDRLDPNNPPEKPWTIQPSNPELLEAIAKDFRENGYSIHHLMKTIMNSSVYQLSASYPAKWNDDYLPYYPRKFVRVLTGPEVVDSLAQVTNSPAEFDFMGTKVHRIKQLSVPQDLRARRGTGEGADFNAILQAFFQTNRMTPAPIGNKGSTLQALLMMQSGAVTRRVLAEKGSRVHTLVSSEASAEAIIDELYLATLARFPTEAESKIAEASIDSDREVGAENLQWALLNTPEFLLNH